jgi:hypothetical protein
MTPLTDIGQREGGPVFELEPEPDYRRVRPLRYLVIGIMSVLIIWLSIVVVRAADNTLPGGTEALAIAGTLLPVGIAVTIWGALGLGRGAQSCQVTLDGFTLVYRGGRTTRFVWKDPSLRFTVFELVSGNQLTYSVATRRPFLNPIPQELYQGLLSEARARGFSLIERSDALPTGRQVKIRVRAFTGPARS